MKSSAAAVTHLHIPKTVTLSERSESNGQCIFAFEQAMKDHTYCFYIIANATRALYSGMTSNLHARVWKHKSGTFEGYTSHFHVCRLVYWESFDDVLNAIDREKQIKRWRREKKIKLIESTNPNWHDLSDGWYEANTKGIAPRLAKRARSG